MRLFFLAWLRWRWLKRALVLAVAATALWLLASLAVAYRLTRRPQAVFAEPAPAVSWGKLESHRLTTADGEEIGAWFSEGADRAPAVLLLHGNGESRRACLGLAELVAGQGCAVLMISHRAHGDSTGTVNDFGYSARHDVVTAVAWLERRRPGRPVIVFGRSLGSAAAVFAAGELGRRVHGYILECPYRDLRTAVRNRTAIYLPKVLDQVAATGLNLVAPLVLPEVDRISPLDAIGQIPATIPTLILAGGTDRRAPPDDARVLGDRVADHCRVVIFQGAAHLKLFASDPGLYRQTVLSFLREVQQGSGR
jgi:alpha-beta hydrolase superfamily lysophospholipase